MPVALLFVLALQQTSPALTWSDAPPPPAAAEASPAANAPALPAQALADPYGWERSQCSPFIRKDEPLAQCQARVRSMLADAMGDKLPEGLSPDAFANCNHDEAAKGYAFQCGTRTVASMGTPAPVEPVCENRPERAGQGLAFNSRCQPVGGDAEAGLRFRLGGD